MKVMWVTNSLVGKAAEKHCLKETSGQWLNAELANEKENGVNEMLVCTSYYEEEIIEDGNIKYIVVPHGNVNSYDVNQKNIDAWKAIIEQEHPDIILIWGTEYDLGRCVLLANDKKIPSLIYIQGVVSSIAKNYRGNLDDDKIKKITTLIEKIRKRSIPDIEKQYLLKVKNEENSVLLADGIICENDWCISIYKKISKNLKVYRNRLPIRGEFGEFKWSDSEQHNIITTSASYPLKGLNVLLEALNEVKKVYSDVKLYIPGPNMVFVKGIKNNLLQSGYNKYLKNYIITNNLEKNVEFVGPLLPKEYANFMKKSDIFVTSSAIENHCSSLREAMMVGIPCVATRVGGIPEYANSTNCELYDFNDVNCLKDCILKLFSNKELRLERSKSAKGTIEAMYADDDKFLSLNEIYKLIINS